MTLNPVLCLYTIFIIVVVITSMNVRSYIEYILIKISFNTHINKYNSITYFYSVLKLVCVLQFLNFSFYHKTANQQEP